MKLWIRSLAIAISLGVVIARTLYGAEGILPGTENLIPSWFANILVLILIAVIGWFAKDTYKMNKRHEKLLNQITTYWKVNHPNQPIDDKE